MMYPICITHLHVGRYRAEIRQLPTTALVLENKNPPMRYADCSSSSSGWVILVCMYVIIPTGSLVWGKLYTYLIPKV